MFELNKVCVVLDGSEILTDISLTIAAGESVVFTGSSGSGKSTLLRLLLGGVPWQRGSYRFCGQQVNADNIAQVRSRSGFIGQEAGLAGATVRQGIMRPYQFSAFADKCFPEQELQRLMQVFGMSSGSHTGKQLLNSAPSTLSGGQRQRMNIIRALLLQHDIVLADEPTSALDDSSAQAVIQELFQRDLTIVSVSHDARWIKHCDRVITLDQGRLVEVDNVRYG